MTVSELMKEELRQILQTVADRTLSPDDALEKLKYLDFEPVGEIAKIDHHRQLRTGFPEVVFGLGKTPEQIVAIMQVIRSRTPLVIATRISQPVFEQLKSELPNLNYYPLAQICTLGTAPLIDVAKGAIAIVTAGTADLPIAEEAAITAELCGYQVQRLWDVGVAGIHRLLAHKQILSAADVLIVVAGMEGALASVVAGLVDHPVIAVPTSVGYGASFNGLAPLLTMLNSCATGVGVVNIDNGFGAAMLACQILRVAHRFKQ
jgi:pyridinium-3,5-biscarboxylic acid mononucleotide synthase